MNFCNKKGNIKALKHEDWLVRKLRTCRILWDTNVNLVKNVTQLYYTELTKYEMKKNFF